MTCYFLHINIWGIRLKIVSIICKTRRESQGFKMKLLNFWSSILEKAFSLQFCQSSPLSNATCLVIIPVQISLSSPPVPDRRQHELRRNQISRPFDWVSWRLVVTPQCGSQLLESENEVRYTGEQASIYRVLFKTRYAESSVISASRFDSVKK
jgi:hypothetical protein